ncbi:hypothetical protein LTR08_007884 [Meristemomyces frigidus]|nr:hypothetical protein LTR08_007884 [Meristemomyces frigidus]
MNQPTGYPPYPTLPQVQYTYPPPNPYPSAQQTPYAYAAPPPPQQHALQQANTLQQQQSQQPFYRPFAQSGAPVQQPQPQHTPTPQARLQQQQPQQRRPPAQASGSRLSAAVQQQQRPDDGLGAAVQQHQRSDDGLSASVQHRRPDDGLSASLQQHHRPDDGAPAGPGAPPPDASSPDLEDQLRDALQRENQTPNEPDGPDLDDDDDANEEDENEPVFNLPPPPEGNYPGEHQLESSLHAWSLEHGYEMVRRASKKNAGGVIYKRYYHCSKHGKLANTGRLTDNSRVRVRRKSNRMGCPMSLAAVAIEPTNPGGEWQIRHRKTHHNHGPLDALALAGHRRRARMGGVEKAVDGLFQIGTPTTQVMQFLQKTNPDGLFTRTDVANMKLKWKKHGTCVHMPGQYSKNPQEREGVASACLRCREKKTKCDSARPVCGTCVLNGWNCEYNHDANPNATTNQPQQQQGTPGAMNNTTNNSMDLDISQALGTPQPGTATGRRAPTLLAAQRAQAEQILADLQNFQAEHVKPKRLELTSSSVEILAHSSCGNCDSYKNVPTLSANADWQAFSDAFLEASLKENTASTLSGEKSEPLRPVGDAAAHDGSAGGGEVEVEEWNEHIKQLAIYHRRNSALLGALWGAVAPGFRTRIMGFQRASEAWVALEAMCCPRGSGEAWRLWGEVVGCTLAGCGGDVAGYVGVLEGKWREFGRVRVGRDVSHDRITRNRPSDFTSTATSASTKYAPAPSYSSGLDVMGEEALCFVFLRNLGPEWKRWVETLCATGNVGGFGTGSRLGFREVARRAVEFEGGGRGGGKWGWVVMWWEGWKS